MHIPTDRLPRQVLYSQLTEGQRPCGCPRLCYKYTIKINIKKWDIDNNSWKSLALQRDVWRDIASNPSALQQWGSDLPFFGKLAKWMGGFDQGLEGGVVLCMCELWVWILCVDGRSRYLCNVLGGYLRI